MGSGEGLPAGAYQGVFEGVEPVAPNPANDYGPGLRWKWKITAGEHTGRIAARVTGVRPTQRNGCGRMLTAVAGTVAPGQTVSPTDYIGRPYMLIVTAGQEGGGTRVESVAPLPQQQQTQQTPQQ
jgi:hypothetical protein